MDGTTAIQRLPRAEEDALLAQVRAECLPESRLKCEYTRQQGSGEVLRSRGFARNVKISYDLMLCQWCGNLEGSENNERFCPAKLRALQEKFQQLTDGT